MAFGRRRKERTGSDGVRLYYASDVHGSDVCWRKFVGAGKFYKADALVMGGDLTGKAVVPIAAGPDQHWRATFLGEERVAADAEGLADLEGSIRLNGMYPWVADPARIAEVAADPGLQSNLFDEVISAEVKRWMRVADERRQGDAPAAYVIAGNDDPWYVDDALRASETMCFCDLQIVDVAGHEMLSASYANPTPWDSPRELPEEELYKVLHQMAEQLENPRSAIFNLHVPPYDSGLDRAIAIDDELRVKVGTGGTSDMPVGSTAVRQIIEEYQPLLALHGHIHESRGATKIGDTTAINSGSEYNTGRIHGVVVNFTKEQVLTHQFVIG